MFPAYFLRLVIPIFALILLPLEVVLAQQPSLINYSVKEGLPSSEVYSVFKDSKGYMWFATDAGVAQFNGNTFKHFTTQDGLPENTIFGFYEDHKKRLWFISMSRKVAYMVNDSIHAVPFNEKVKNGPEPSSFITSLVLDEKEQLWIGYNRPRYALVKDPFGSTPSYEVIVPPGTCYLMEKNNAGDIWGGTISWGKYDLFYQADDTSFILDLDQKVPLTPIERNFQGVNVINHNKIYIHQGKVVFLLKDKFISSKRKFPETVLFTTMDAEGNLWVGRYGNGVDFFRNGDLSQPPVHYFPGVFITGVFHDHEKSYWFSTLTNGVYFAPNIKVRNYELSNGSDKRINAVEVCGNEKVFAGSNSGGVFSVNTVSGEIRKLPDAGLGPVKTMCMAGDKLWIGGTRGLADWNDGEKNYGKRILFMARALFHESDTSLLLGKNANLCRYNYKEYGSAPYVVGVPTEYVAVLHIVRSDKGTVYLGSTEGLKIYDGEVVKDVKEPEAVGKNRVDFICAIDDKLWLATRNLGVLIFDPATNTVDTLDTRKGLASNLCRIIHRDNEGTIWVGTNKGISRIKAAKDGTYIVQNITMGNGLASNEVNSITSIGALIAVGTNEGLSLFTTDDVPVNTFPPPVYLNSIKINEELVPVQDRYFLNHDQNFIEIDFNGLSYKNAGKVLYKLKMSGIDKDWVYTQHPGIQYTTLPPGDYTFSVYAMNNDGIWSSIPAQVSFVIAKPYWETWWFISCMAGVFIGGSWLSIRAAYRRKSRLQTERNEFERRIIEEELKTLRAQMNPHFIFNSLNSIQRFVLESDSASAYKYLNKFSKLLRSVLNHSRTDIVSLAEEISTLRNYLDLEGIRFTNKFRYEIQVDPAIDPEIVKVPGMLLQPFVENSIWHGLMPRGGEGCIFIRFKLADGMILCEIEDNGVGRSQARQSDNTRKSLGIIVTRERIETINYRYKTQAKLEIKDLFENGQPKGTLVQVILPNVGFQF